MRSRRDSLVQLGNSRNTMSQFRLTDRHDGQQKSVIELEIYQQADLLKSLDAFNRLRAIEIVRHQPDDQLSSSLHHQHSESMTPSHASKNLCGSFDTSIMSGGQEATDQSQHAEPAHAPPTDG